MNEIENNINDLFNELEASELYKDYVRVKMQLKNNDEINNLINDIKRLQKIATNNKDEKVELEIKMLYDKLHMYPIYQSYLSIKEKIEDELFEIKEPLDKYFENILKI